MASKTLKGCISSIEYNVGTSLAENFTISPLGGGNDVTINLTGSKLVPAVERLPKDASRFKWNMRSRRNHLTKQRISNGFERINKGVAQMANAKQRSSTTKATGYSKGENTWLYDRHQRQARMS
jgi:hypothetical protein